MENVTVTKTFEAILFNRTSSIPVKVEQLVNGKNRNEISYRINGQNYSHKDYWNLSPIPVKG